MNMIIFIMLVFAFVGLLDKIFNNRLGLVEAFDKGIQSMGTLALSMIGFYCIAVTMVNRYVESITAFSQYLHIDPSIMLSCLLAPDLGGYSIVHTLTSDTGMNILAGLMITSTIGTVISFQLPLFLTVLNKDVIKSYLYGLIYGIIVVPMILLPLGIILQIEHIFISILPVFIICFFLIFGLIFIQRQTMTFLVYLGEIIRILSLIFFGLVIFSCYKPEYGFTSMSFIQESLLIVFKCTLIVIGSMILCELILKYFSKYINQIANYLGVNSYSIMGLFLQMASSVAIFPIFSKMDTKGKMMNGAFSVSGAYVLGAQLGFVSSVASNYGLIIYVMFKLIAGFLSVLLVYKFNNRESMT